MYANGEPAEKEDNFEEFTDEYLREKYGMLCFTLIFGSDLSRLWNIFVASISIVSGAVMCIKVQMNLEMNAVVLFVKTMMTTIERVYGKFIKIFKT